MFLPSMESETKLQSIFDYKALLENLVKRNLNPILLKRVSIEDVVQDVFEKAIQSEKYLENNPEIPLYFKLRTILFQVITSLERQHLQSQKRDAYKDVDLSNELDDSGAKNSVEIIADSITGPFTRLAKADRYEVVKRVLLTLSESDRQIIELRHFDDLSNSECAKILQITEKNASIKYVRALEKMQLKLREFTEFNV